MPKLVNQFVVRYSGNSYYLLIAVLHITLFSKKSFSSICLRCNLISSYGSIFLFLMILDSSVNFGFSLANIWRQI